MHSGQPKMMVKVSETCTDDAEVLALSLLRMVMAGYSTGDVACWDMAYAGAERVLRPETAGRLVASVTTLVRTVRAERRSDLAFMPATCCRVTRDEGAIVRLMAAARSGGVPQDLTRAVADVTGALSSPLVEAAARALACLLDEAADGLIYQPDHRRDGPRSIH